MRIQTECIVRREEEAGCFVLRTNVPPAGDLAQSARDILTVDKDPHGTEQNYGFLQDPVIVNRLLLKKPERIEALGLVLWLALLIWRVMERSMRAYVDTSGTPLTGWDHKATERPTTVMMVTQCAGVIVVQRGAPRQLARPLSVIQPQYLTALDVAIACFTDGPSG
jgi:transposase